MSIHLAVGKSARSNRITSQRQLSFEQLGELLRGWPVHIGRLTLEQYLALKGGSKEDKNQAASDKDTAWFSLGRFAKPQRAAANVLEISGWVGDFDSGALTADEISAPLGGCSHILLTSYSHSPAQPKWRLIVPYARSVTPDEHAKLYNYFAAIYGDAVDTSTRDPCRLWYFPSTAADTQEFRELHVREGDGLFDPDVMLAAIAEEESADEALPQRVAAGGSHPNDALAYSPNREKPTADEVRRMLACINLENATGKRRGPWLKVLQGVHDWAEGSDEGFQLIHEWSAAQPGYVDEADVRKIWDSCRGKGVTIASVISMAVEAGYSRGVDEEAAESPEEVVEIPPELQQIIQALDGGAKSIRERVQQEIGEGHGKAVAALKALESELIYVADQQEYFSLRHRALLSKDAIRQMYKSAMPKTSEGKRMDPCRLLENSTTKRVVSSMGYHPGETEIYFEHARPLTNWHHPYPIEPLTPTARETALFMQLLNHLFPSRADYLFQKYLMTMLAYLVQHPGAKVSSAPLLFSRETGTGKTTMLYEVPARLFGPLNSTLVTNDEMESGFSDFLAKKHFLHLDEIFMGGMRQAAAAANKFKPVVTNSTIKVHPKGFAGYDITNRLVVTACSNYDNAVHLTDFDRRWAVHEVRSGKLDKGFASALYQFMESDRGPGVLRWMFLNIPTAGFNPHGDAPMTREKRAMIDASLGLEEGMIRSHLRDQRHPFDKDFFAFDEANVWLETQTGKRLSPQQFQQRVQVAIPRAKYLLRAQWGTAVIRLWVCRNFERWAAAGVEEISEHLGGDKLVVLPDEEEIAA